MYKYDNINKMVWAWEYFKESVEEAHEIFKAEKEAYVVFCPGEKTFRAFPSPHPANPLNNAPADEVIVYFSDDFESFGPQGELPHCRPLNLDDMALIFTPWIEFNHSRIF